MININTPLPNKRYTAIEIGLIETPSTPEEFVLYALANYLDEKKLLLTSAEYLIEVKYLGDETFRFDVYENYRDGKKFIQAFSYQEKEIKIID